MERTRKLNYRGIKCRHNTIKEMTMKCNERKEVVRESDLIDVRDSLW